MPSGYQLDKVHNTHRNMIIRSYNFFAMPYKHTSAKIKKPPDRLIITVHALIYVTVFYLLYVLIGTGRIMSIVSRKKWNRLKIAIKIMHKQQQPLPGQQE